MRKKILIIDDEPDILKTTKCELELDGYDCFTADDGEEGLRKIDEIIPDLLLLDLRLPGKNGFQIAREIKSKGAHRDIPIIIFSAMTGHAAKRIAVKEKALEFIEKPINIDKLKFHIRDILAQGR